MLNTECKQFDEPEFKVGDYVTYKGVENKIAKIDSIDADELHGLWYGQETEVIRQDLWLKGGHTVRRATQEEIAEYESALNFHKHGRKPFEFKKGDLIRTPSEKITFTLNSENFTKKEFIECGWEFLKTAEEIDEWLGVSDDK